MELYRQALQLAREDGSRYAQAEALIGLATCQRRLDRPHEAAAFARRALAIAQEAGYRLLEAQAREAAGPRTTDPPERPVP